MLEVQIGVTILSVAAVLFSALGILRLRHGAVSAQRRMDHERNLRADLRETLRVRQAAAPKGREGIDELNAATTEWVRAHEAAGLEPVTNGTISIGREFLAEKIIVELARSTHTDTLLVGIGLACGLAASIWGTWAL